jgi:hypothetical protein
MCSKIIQAGEWSILDHEVGSTLPRILTTILLPLGQGADLTNIHFSSTIVPKRNGFAFVLVWSSATSWV